MVAPCPTCCRTPRATWPYLPSSVPRVCDLPWNPMVFRRSFRKRRGSVPTTCWKPSRILLGNQGAAGCRAPRQRRRRRRKKRRRRSHRQHRRQRRGLRRRRGRSRQQRQWGGEPTKFTPKKSIILWPDVSRKESFNDINQGLRDSPILELFALPLKDRTVPRVPHYHEAWPKCETGLMINLHEISYYTPQV